MLRDKENKKLLLLHSIILLLLIFSLVTLKIELNIILLVTIFYLITIIITWYHLYKKNKKIKNLSTYMNNILNNNYSLDIRDYEEGDLSNLKNDIYKMTVKLKEKSDLNLKEKKYLEEVLSDISHQLKTPLTSILVMLDNIIEDSNMEEKIRNDFIVDIKRNVLNINFLVQSLLKLSKFDANTVHFVKQENDLKTIVEESIKNVSTLCDLRNINIKLNIKENSKIICDDKWQIEALTNIIKNAIEHSKNNSNIIINIENNNVYSMIEVIDFGEGIAKKDIKHIFERFYRCKNTKTDSIGIGLALAKTIIEEDKGTISVESNKLETKFIIKYYKI